MAVVERMSSGSGNTWGCGVHLEAVSATTAHVLVVDLTHGLKTLFTRTGTSPVHTDLILCAEGCV